MDTSILKKEKAIFIVPRGPAAPYTSMSQAKLQLSKCFHHKVLQQYCKKKKRALKIKILKPAAIKQRLKEHIQPPSSNSECTFPLGAAEYE